MKPESRTRMGAVTMAACGLLVTGLAAGGHGDRVEPAPSTLVTGVITGDVHFSGSDRRPVRGVDVWASDSVTGIDAGRTETDDSGRFTLKVAPGRYVVVAGGRGAPLNVSYGARHDDLPPAPVVVREGDQVEVHLEGPRASVLSGIVRDDRGQPIADAYVELRPRVTPFEWRKPGVIRQAGTDVNGAYRIFGVRPGAYVVFVGTRIAPIPGLDFSSKRHAPAPRYHPGTAYESDAATVMVHQGEDRANVDIMLPLEPVFDLAATAVLPDGGAFRGDLFVVARLLTGPPVESSGVSIDRQTFFVALQRARYQLDVRAVSRPVETSVSPAGREYYSRTIIEPSNVEAGTFQVSLSPGMNIAGRILIGSQPAGGIGVRLVPMSASPPAVREGTATSDQNGRFSADGLAAGRYAVELDRVASGSWMLDTVRFSGHVVTDGAIELDRSIAPEELELTVVPKSARLSGRVIDAAAGTVSSYVVVMLSAGEVAGGRNMRTVALARPDNTGRYLFSHQTAGSYVLFLVADPEPADIDLVVEGARRDSSNGVPATLKPDSEATLDLRIRTLTGAAPTKSREPK